MPDCGVKKTSRFSFPSEILPWALLLCCVSTFVCLSFAQHPAPVIRATVDVVNVLCTVRDRSGQYVSTLKREDFKVYEDGVQQQIDFFVYETGEQAQPLTVVLLMDTSGSVKQKLQFEQEAATEFLRETLRKQKDLAAVVQFDSEINLVQDFTSDLSRLNEAIMEIRAGGATKLYDAIWLAVGQLLRDEIGRKVLVILSDGADTQSQVSEKEAIRVAQDEDVIIYGIGVRTARFGAKFGKLKKFAKATGGMFFNSKARLKELRTAFARINQEIKNQYSIGYVSSNQKRDGKLRKIELRLKGRGLKVTHRKGYYSPADATGTGS